MAGRESNSIPEFTALFSDGRRVNVADMLAAQENANTLRRVREWAQLTVGLERGDRMPLASDDVHEALERNNP